MARLRTKATIPLPPCSVWCVFSLELVRAAFDPDNRRPAIAVGGRGKALSLVGFVDVKQFVTVVEGRLVLDKPPKSFRLRPFRRKHERDRGDVLLYMKVSVDLLLAIVVLRRRCAQPIRHEDWERRKS